MISATGSVLPRSRPAAEGIDSRQILAFLTHLDREDLELHSLMMVRGGHIVAEGWWTPYTPDEPHLLYSLSKSFTSVAAGIAIGRGLFRLDDFLSDLLPEAAAYGDATVRDALRMSTGHLTDFVLDPTAPAVGWSATRLLEAVRAYAPEARAGDFFTYDQLATFMVSTVIESRAGTTLQQFLQEHLFAPMGISDARWTQLEGGGNPGFTGLHLTTEAIAAFGQLLLQEGRWKEQQLVPSVWVREATRTQISTDAARRYPPHETSVDIDGSLGYGYQFWISSYGYRADGAYGQTCLVIPDLDLVIVTTGCISRMQDLLDAVWTHLIPATAGNISHEHDEVLADRLRALTLTPPTSTFAQLVSVATEASLALLAGAPSPDAAHAFEQLRIRGLPLHPPETRDVSNVTFERASSWASAAPKFGGLGGDDLPEVTRIHLLGDTLHLAGNHGLIGILPVRADDWEAGVLTPTPAHAAAVSAAGGWTPEGLFVTHIRLINTPHSVCTVLNPATRRFHLQWCEPTLAGPSLLHYTV